MEVYLDNSATTMCYPEVGELVIISCVGITGIRRQCIGREWKLKDI